MKSQTKVYLIRHVHTNASEKHIFQGQIDYPISKLGENQLSELNFFMKDKHIDALYTSPLERAKITAEEIASLNNLNVTVCKDLIDINGGAFEGKSFDLILEEFPKEFRTYLDRPFEFKGVRGGETYLSVYNRIVKAINELVKRNKNRSIAIITHGTCLELFLHYLSGGTTEESINQKWIPNGACTFIIFDDDFVPTIQYIGLDSYLSNKFEEIKL
ncbi:histidine phosphatase family protein [Blautia pseudococcoides]|nr:histidine phosphatase family protein [Blautia pseudococcoides]